MTTQPGSPERPIDDGATDQDGDLPELVPGTWFIHAEALSRTGFLAMARRLPALILEALRLAWRASRRDTTATIALNIASGAFTAFGLLATTGVLQALFATGPTPGRVRAALPSLVLVG